MQLVSYDPKYKQDFIQMIDKVFELFGNSKNLLYLCVRKSRGKDARPVQWVSLI